MLCAGRAYGPFGFVKPQALLFEIEFTIVQQRANLRLGVGYHFFVLHAVHAAGQRLVPVVHHPGVITVVLADVFQAISESLPAGEQLLEAGKTAAHRVAPRVDDLAVGQNQVDQSDVLEIIGHLIDKKWVISSALDAGGFQVTLAQLPDLVLGQLGK